MAIRIAPRTPGTLLTSEILIVISSVTIGMLLRETVDHMLAFNASVESLVAETVKIEHAGDVVVVEDGIFQKLELIILTTVLEDAVHRMALALEEELIKS